MAIKGDLTTINLGDIFQTLTVNKKTGVLNIHCGQRHKNIYLRDGEIFTISVSYSEWAFGDFLLKHGFLSNEQYTDIQKAREKDPETSYETILLDRDIFKENQVEDLITLQITEEIYDLFTWDDGEFAFEENDEFLLRKHKSGLTDTRIMINTSGLILEAARRADEWERFKEYIRSSKDIFKKQPFEAGNRPALTLEDDDRIVLEAVNGDKDVSEIAFEISLGIFEVYSSLFKLRRTNLIASLSIEELIEVGRKHMESGNYSKAVKVFERVNEIEEDEPEYISLYAEALEKFGNIRSAAIQYILIGTITATQGDNEQSVNGFRKVIELTPDDTVTRERLAMIYESQKRRQDALVEYRKLAEHYEKNRAYEDAQEALRKVLVIDENDIDARKKLGHILIESGNTGEGIVEYQIAAEKLYETMKPEDLEEALAVYEKIVSVNEESPELRMELANLYTMLEKHKQAVSEYEIIAEIYERMPDTADGGPNSAKWELLIDVYKQILTIDPDNIEAKEKIANALMQAGTSEKAKEQYKNIAQELQEKGDIVRSTEFLQKVTSLEPADLSARFSLASNLISKGKYNDAILEYKGIAIAAKKNNDLDNAEQAYSRIVELNPFEINAHKGLADVYYKQGEVEKSVGKYNDLGMICYGGGLYEPALGSYQLVHNLDPSNKDVLPMMSDLYVKLGDDEQAASILGDLAEMYAKEANFQKACYVYRDAVRISASSTRLLDRALTIALKVDAAQDIVRYGKTLAALYEKEDNLDAAIDVYEKVHRKFPEELQVLGEFARLLEKQGNVARACRYYRELSRYYLQNDLIPQSKEIILKAEKLMPDDTRIQLVLALLAARSGDIKEAQDRFKRILELDPEDVLALKGYGDILVREGSPEKALEHYSTAYSIFEDKQQYDRMVGIQEAILSLKPDDIGEKIKLAEIYEVLGDEIKLNICLSEAAHILIKEGDSETAYSMIRKFLDRNPMMDNVRRTLFNLALEQGDKDFAASEGVRLARHCMERRDFENAEVIIDYVLKFAPQNVYALIERDRIYFEKGDENKGLQSVQESIRVLRDNENYFLLKRHLRDVQKYIPDNAGIHETLGAVYAKEGAFYEAIDEYSIARTLFTQSDNTQGADECSGIIEKLSLREESREKEDGGAEDVAAVFKTYDAASEKEKISAKDRILEVIQDNAFSETNLLKLEKECAARNLESLELEIKQKLVKMFLARDVYTKAKEVFSEAGSYFRDNIEILHLMSMSAEQKGDFRFAGRCLERLFKEYDNSGNTELAVAVCARILSIEPYNKKAVRYIGRFADSKKRFTDDWTKEQEPEPEEGTAADIEKKDTSRKLLELCQSKLKDAPSKGKKFKKMQKKFITGMTEESLGNYDESIRIFSELEKSL